MYLYEYEGVFMKLLAKIIATNEIVYIVNVEDRHVCALYVTVNGKCDTLPLDQFEIIDPIIGTLKNLNS